MITYIVLSLNHVLGKPVELTAPIEETEVKKEEDVALEVTIPQPEPVAVEEVAEAEITVSETPAETTPVKGGRKNCFKDIFN